jgi:predicted ATPase/DNA-binding CsgD family transcriptional regulator
MDAYNQDPLTDRELDIVRLLAQGLTDRAIAEQLVLSPETVRWYNKQIYSKLHVGNRTEAAQRARALGLLAPEEPGSEPRQAQSRHNLPVPLTPFIGRKRELGQLTALLGQDDIRLVTILAPGGMGKTRLALEVARSQIGSFLHGVHYIPLEGIGAASHISLAVAQRLGLRLDNTASAKEDLLSLLRNRWLLLLFDGFEEVLEDGKELIREMLSAVPGLKVLVTSRAPLGIEGETLFALGGLDYPELPDADDVADYGSVALFLQSARRSRPEYAAGKRDLAEIGLICRHVQGMPLAIVLAANWIYILPPAQIREDLQRNLDLLSAGSANMPARQRSIQAVFNYAWSQLSPNLRDVYMTLAVFRRDFSRQAAIEIGETTLQEIAALSDHALLSYEPADDRYQLHAVLRWFAYDALAASGRLEVVRRRHMAHYLKLLQTREADLKGPRQLEALRQLDADFENLREAWRCAVFLREAEAIARSHESLFWLCQMRGRVPDGEALLDEARRTFGGRQTGCLQRQLLVRCDASGSNYRDQLTGALARAKEEGDAFEIGLLHWALGVNGYVSQAFRRAIADLQQALQRFNALNDNFYMTEVHHLLGFCARFGGAAEEADRFAARAMETARATGNKIALARSLGSQAVFDAFRGDLNAAEKQTREALAIRTEHGDVAGMAMSKASLGLIAMLRGRLDEATALAREARDLATAVGHPNSRETANIVLGWTACLEEDYERGRQLCLSSLQSAPDPNVAYMATIGLAFAACGRGDVDAAQARLDAILAPIVSMAGPRGLLTCLPVLAVLSAHADRKLEAVQWLAVASNTSEETRAWVSIWPLTKRLVVNLEADLGAEAYGEAWQQGLALTTSVVAEKLGIQSP